MWGREALSTFVAILTMCTIVIGSMLPIMLENSMVA